METTLKVEAKILNDQSSVLAAKYKGRAAVEGCSIDVYIEALYWLPYEASVC